MALIASRKDFDCEPLQLIDELGGTWTEKVTVIHTSAG